MNLLAERINAALPQTQCTRCGYPDCAAYAQAIASGEAAINQCPPGGIEGVQRLAAITGQPVMALNPENGSEGPRQLAIIDEAWCIGCTLCLDACPVDAIVGSNKLMHTVIEACCTGCELCIPVCPVDCISLENIAAAKTGWAAWSEVQAEQAGRRYQIRINRHRAREGSMPEGLADPGQSPPSPQADPLLPGMAAGDNALQRKRSIIDAALASAKARRNGSSQG